MLSADPGKSRLARLLVDIPSLGVHSHCENLHSYEYKRLTLIISSLEDIILR